MYNGGYWELGENDQFVGIEVHVFQKMKTFGDKWRCWLQTGVNVLKATELHPLKWLKHRPERWSI